ncbi:14114_t:CDS:2, partial [Dentiscutata heterogama]
WRSHSREAESSSITSIQYFQVLDRVLVQNQDQETLLNDLVEVLEEVQAHFQKQFVGKENSYTE